MDWLRRNWPDLLIGVALVAVVALIVVTLLSGGSLASLVRRDTPPELSITDTAADTAADTATASDTQTDGRTSNTAATAGSDTTNTGSNGIDGGVDVFVPGVPGAQADAASGGQAQASRSPGTTGAQTESGGVAQSNQGNVPSGGPLPEATQDGGFRVAAGAVDSRDAAAGLAESYRDADYTVTVEQQGDLYLLWIGPYATRPGADRVAAQLQADGLVPDALVYSYSGPDSADNSSVAAGNSSGGGVAAGPTPGAITNAPFENTGAAPASGATAAGVAPTTTASTGSTAASGATGPRYLQVGAFVSDESAEPLRAQLETLGFTVTRRVSGTGLVRLLVGPFADAQLARTQARLQNEGIPDAFPVTP